MPRQSKQEVEVNFTKGLITESTALRFPKDASTDTYNCVFAETGELTRRLGIDTETAGTASSLTEGTGEAYSEYVWNAVGGEGDRSFLVVQRGNTLEFYDISTSVATVSGNRKTFSVDISQFIPVGSSLTAADKVCKFADGNGNLLVVNGAIDPVLVVYNETLDTVTSTAVELKTRDFVGVEDGLEVDERLTSTEAGLKGTNPEHYYNLVNQGWHYKNSLAQWDTNATTMPSNADSVGFFLSDATGALDATLVAAKTGGNSSTPRGHFILNTYAPNRTQALVDDDFTGVAISTTEELVDVSGSTNIGTFTSLSNAFDGNTATTSVGSVGFGSYAYIGKTLAAPSRIYRVRIENTSVGGAVGLSTWLYGKQGAAPSSATDGTVLGNLPLYSAANPTVDASIISSDTTTEFDHVWLTTFYSISSTATLTVGELTFYKIDEVGDEQPITLTRPTSTAFFAGRAWYAGVNGLDLNNTVFFSQIIQKNDQYGKCYQQNDPTSQDFPDLLQDDGGFIKIPGASTITHIGAFHNSLLVFATNGVWAVSGSNKQYFTATAYGVRKISGVGTSASTSFANVKGVPYWWGESGIYTVSYDPNYDAYEVQSLTDTTIFSFFNTIPSQNRRFVKASYDIDTETITWLYNSAASITSADYYKFTNALVFNTLSKAFYPWSFGVSSDVPIIRGAVHVRAALDSSSSITKYLATTTADGSDSLQFAELRDATYTDWPSYSSGIDYSSYAITGYSYDGALMRKSSPLYVMVYVEDQEYASAYLRAIFDWTTSTSEGKTSTSQQIYPSSTNRTVKARRLKVRGNGRALQLKFFSESGKPFTIVGWATVTTTDSGL